MDAAEAISHRDEFRDILLSSSSFNTHKGQEENFAGLNFPKFFDSWFKSKGTPLFFLFKKNLSVTNIQYAELLSLLQKLTTHTSGSSLEYQFASTKEIRSVLIDLIADFYIKHKSDAKLKYALISNQYFSLIERTIIIDPYYGSCSVFLPPGLNLDLAKLCAEAGYIHSCGYNIYVRNVNKANNEEF